MIFRHIMQAALISSALASSGAWAQAEQGSDAAPAVNSQPDRETFRDLARTATSSANDPREGFVNSGFELVSGVESGQVSLTLARERDTPRRFGRTSIALTLKAPFNEDDEEGFLITRNGIPGGFGADISISGILGSYRPPSDMRPIADLTTKWDLACARDALVKGKTAPDDEGLEENRFNNYCQTRVGMRARDLSRYLTPDEIARFNQAWGTDTGIVDQSIIMPSLTAGIGIQDFTFRDPVTLVEQKERKTSWSVTGSLGWLPSPRAPFFLAGFEYRRSFKAPDDEIICPPASTTPVTCTEGKFAPPERNIDQKIFGLMRVLEPLGVGGTAIELKAAYDIKDDIVGLEMPLYVFLDKDHKLRGGVRVGWDSDEDDVKFGVFIGVPFNFLAR